MLQLMQLFLNDSDSGCLDLKLHCIALAIAKMTLDENSFKHAQRKQTVPYLFQSW